ncbi:ATP-binding protein [Kitasatospora sp. DSM 101779]|uniref:ATP-binding protein n=1 Tax=Kitasatospora sp. DSM 101779 TaxID=2853165 RepID=UPI0021D9844F|nr:ATP-binding protein [Kitasatospora sp. DSM 101779]MCU7821264.1 ATP-binding protein [Kitasatospora sp. DSM 101779]
MAKGIGRTRCTAGAARSVSARRRCYFGTPGDIRSGRDFTTRVLDEWGRPGGEDRRADMLLVVSELLSNALLHGRSPIELTLVRDGPCARIEVFDTGPGSPAPREPREAVNAPGGRGLHIVDRLTTDWGVVRHPRGKTVWADVSLNHRERPAHR